MLVRRKFYLHDYLSKDMYTFIHVTFSVSSVVFSVILNFLKVCQTCLFLNASFIAHLLQSVSFLIVCFHVVCKKSLMIWLDWYPILQW